MESEPVLRPQIQAWESQHLLESRVPKHRLQDNGQTSTSSQPLFLAVALGLGCSSMVSTRSACLRPSTLVGMPLLFESFAFPFPP